MNNLTKSGVRSGVRGLILGLMLFTPLFLVTKAQAITSVPVRLAWDASPDITVAGYRVYYNTVGQPLTNRLDVGSARAAVLPALTASANYAFYVVAYNLLGIESLPSNTMQYVPPAVSRITLAKLGNGAMQIKFSSAAGSQCRIQYASSPQNPQWQTLSTSTADANGNVTVTDPLTGRPPMRFYRAMRL